MTQRILSGKTSEEVGSFLCLFTFYKVFKGSAEKSDVRYPRASGSRCVAGHAATRLPGLMDQSIADIDADNVFAERGIKQRPPA